MTVSEVAYHRSGVSLLKHHLVICSVVTDVFYNEANTYIDSFYIKIFSE